MTESSNGSQTATLDTEHTLDTQTSAGVYQLKVDLSNMADGDILELRVKTRARSADGTDRLEYFATYANAQALPIATSIPVTASRAVFTLKQTDGTGRTYTWSVNSI
jgi:hypothetical protein